MQSNDVKSFENILPGFSYDNFEIGTKKNVRAYEILKRFIDIILALFAILIFSPLLILIAFLIKKEDGGPAIHKRLCVGKGNKTYVMYKFRSMCPDADNLRKWFSSEQIDEYRKEIKLRDDPRITKIGAFIRKTSIDELPQLFSILFGHMSFVGPRPMTEEESAHFGPVKDNVLSVKPGLTGYWQVNGRSDCTYKSGKRQELELYYVAHRSLIMDLKILIKTFTVVVHRKGAY